MFSVKTGTAAVACRPYPIREKGVLKSPQAFQNPKISNNSSSEAAQSSAEGILNRPFPRHCRAAALPSASTAAAMAGAAAHSTEGAAAEAAAPTGAATIVLIGKNSEKLSPPRCA